MYKRFKGGYSMNWINAKNQIEDILKRNFKYLYVKNNLDINTIHLTFQMDSITEVA